ncbi:lysylphosphatidylglycerol synthase transmembrane domain-containing protein [Parvicella tangerina]|uniref:Uncharacterized protein n=1 Tax=Parvicella tangerina TaxID=2829795 RepID=A0A916JMI0_9FLAO|nr:lysylphosphatidylglycerol synthase transmembrane domain-containing protein [Parvicella tangerina]CAG5080557.1 hypothetical protein CRYO30217_01373 [Parvicella tangerina]
MVIKLSNIKNNKLYQPLVFAVKLIIFALAIYYLYTQFTHRNLDNLGDLVSEHLFQTQGILLFTGLVLLQFVNYGLENLKWRQTLPLLKESTFLRTQKAVYAGNAVAILTPDRLGTFIGRFTYIKEIPKTTITFSTFVGNYAQLVTTLLFALIGLILSWNFAIGFHYPEQLPINTLIIVMTIVCCMALFIFYQQKVLLELLRKLKWKYLNNLITKLEFLGDLTELRLHTILGIAILRYLVFIAQFHVALTLFGAEPELIWTAAFCGVLYLFSTLIPSPFMGNLGTREAIAVFLVIPFGLEETVIIASLFIWLINVVLPSIIGGIILLKK